MLLTHSAGFANFAFLEPDGKLRIHFALGTRYAWMCLQQARRCVVILANDVRAEAAFPHLVRFLLGETGTPWRWEYGAMKFWEGLGSGIPRQAQ